MVLRCFSLQTRLTGGDSLGQNNHTSQKMCSTSYLRVSGLHIGHINCMGDSPHEIDGLWSAYYEQESQMNESMETAHHGLLAKSLVPGCIPGW